MEKPRITIYKVNGEYLGYNQFVDNWYGKLYPIQVILNILSIPYSLQKDDKGNYRTDLDLYKPKFD